LQASKRSRRFRREPFRRAVNLERRAAHGPRADRKAARYGVRPIRAMHGSPICPARARGPRGVSPAHSPLVPPTKTIAYDIKTRPCRTVEIQPRARGVRTRCGPEHLQLVSLALLQPASIRSRVTPSAGIRMRADPAAIRHAYVVSRTYKTAYSTSASGPYNCPLRTGQRRPRSCKREPGLARPPLFWPDRPRQEIPVDCSLRPTRRDAPGRPLGATPHRLCRRHRGSLRGDAAVTVRDRVGRGPKSDISWPDGRRHIASCIREDFFVLDGSARAPAESRGSDDGRRCATRALPSSASRASAALTRPAARAAFRKSRPKRIARPCSARPQEAHF